MTSVVEGDIDEAAVHRIFALLDIDAGPTYGRSGKEWIRGKITAFSNAAKFSPWVVLVDLDNEAECPPDLLPQWVPHPAEFLCFRVAVREVEAWLLGDPKALSAFLSVGRVHIPSDPEQLPDPKLAMVNLARRSRNRAVREDMIPRPGSGRTTGQAYGARMIEFAANYWRPEEAARSCESLRRAIECLEVLRQRVVAIVDPA